MIAALSLAVALLAQRPAAVPTPQALPSMTLRTPRAWLRVQVARTPAQRERGLMGVTALAPRTGMLFVFPSDSVWEFWMKDTLIDLDMVWVRQDGNVSHVEERVPHSAPQTPDQEIATRSGYGSYVIELPAGEAVRDGLVAGAHLGGLPTRPEI